MTNGIGKHDDKGKKSRRDEAKDRTGAERRESTDGSKRTGASGGGEKK